MNKKCLLCREICDETFTHIAILIKENPNSVAKTIGWIHRKHLDKTPIEESELFDWIKSQIKWALFEWREQS